jgi:hypothetical protein
MVSRTAVAADLVTVRLFEAPRPGGLSQVPSLRIFTNTVDEPNRVFLLLVDPDAVGLLGDGIPDHVHVRVLLAGLSGPHRPC